MKILTIWIVAIVLIAGASATAAVTVSPASASTTSPEFFAESNVDFVIDEVIDFDQWVALTMIGSPTVHFVLPGMHNLTGVNIWNNGGFIELDAEGVNGFTLNFFDPGLAAVGSFSGNFTDTLAMQTIGFSVSNVAFVDLVVNSSHGAPYAIFHEISFNTAPIPIPAAAWLFGSALGMLGWVKRRA